jgi:fucokinase
MVEQLLSSGGGWQDQAHGTFPGVKTVTSQPPTIPLKIKVEPLIIPKESMIAFEKRLIFAYTGQTRLAKNILKQVLRRWSRRTPEIVHTVESLVKCSENIRKAYLDEDWDLIADTMYQSFQLKCVMAGRDSGAEPTEVQVFISELLQAQLIKGAMLCGAGGGGFLLLVTSKEAIDQTEIESFFQKNIMHLNKKYEDFCFYTCNIARKGLTTHILNSTLDAESFDMSWQSSGVDE